MKAQTCWDRMKTPASEAEKPRNSQQKSMQRKCGGGASKHSTEVGAPQMRRSQEAESQLCSEALTRAPSGEDEILQNSTACVDGRSLPTLANPIFSHAIMKGEVSQSLTHDLPWVVQQNLCQRGRFTAGLTHVITLRRFNQGRCKCQRARGTEHPGPSSFPN